MKPVTESDNYRPIAIATAISKLFEMIILSKCENFLLTTENQFGFKKNHSTDLCIFALKDLINYYTTQGSPVFICYLDIKKAFDRVNFSILFNKLVKRSVPIYLVKIIAFWYSSQLIVIRWGSNVSAPIKVSNGIKQGGLLSPFLFNIYLDNLSINLTASGVGCMSGAVLVNHLSYADDMVLLAPSKRALQKLLDICSEYARLHDILYNTEKSYCMVCWPKRILFKFYPVFYLQNDVLEYVNVYKYLGVMIDDQLRDDDEMNKRMRSIYATGNMLIRKFKNCTIECKLLMFKTFFSNIYASGLWSNYRVASFCKVKVSHNDIFRSLLQVPRYESASTLFVQYDVRNLDSLLRASYYSLMTRVRLSENSIISSLARGEARLHSRLWQRWGVSLGSNLVEDQ